MLKGNAFVSVACTTLLLAVTIGCTPHPVGQDAETAAPSGANNGGPSKLQSIRSIPSKVKRS